MNKLLEQLQQRLQESEHFYRLILSHISDAVLLTDSTGNFTFICPNTKVIFGYSLREIEAIGNIEKILGQNLFNEDELNQKGEIKNIEYEITDKAGKKHILLITVKQVTIGEGTVLYTCHDITERKKAEEKLNQYKNKIKKIVEERVTELTQVNQQLRQEIEKNQQTEEALKQSKNRYRSIIDDQTELICRFWTDGTLTFVNQSFCRYFNQPHEALIGNNFLALLPDDNVKQIQELLRGLTPEHPLASIEYKTENGLGEKQSQQWNARAIFDGTGGVAEYQLVGQDITERKHMEEALIESREKYRVLFQNLPIGISLTDESGNVIETNLASERMIGLSRSQYNEIKKDPNKWVVIHPNGIRLSQEEFSSAIALRENRLVSNQELGIVRPNQEVIWLNLTAAPIPLPDYGVALAYIDITDYKKAEASLRFSERRFRSLSACSPVGIFLTDVKGNPLYSNPRLSEITGLMHSNRHSCDWMEGIHPQERTEAREQWHLAIHRQQAFSGQYRLLTPVGEVRWVQVRTAPLLSEENELLGYVGTLEDISERHQAEENLRQQAEQERLMVTMQKRIHHSLDLNVVLNTAVEEVRKFLGVDRVLIYQFNENDNSTGFIAESASPHCSSILNKKVIDPCFKNKYAAQYQQGKVSAIADTNQAHFAPCYQELLDNMDVRAMLIIPIVYEEKLWGLLCAHHCSEARHWQTREIDFLRQLTLQLAIAIQQSELYQQLQKANHKLHELASLDGLTQVANRRRFDEYLTEEWERHARKQEPLSLILCDIDFFKNYNDTYGHQAGDACLQQVAQTLSRVAKRPGDLVARYGGEEFTIVLPNTQSEGAIFLAQEIQRAIKALQIAHINSSVTPVVTLSLGVATILPTPQSNPARLIRAADQALYQAKANGRDQAIAHTLPTP